MTTQTRTPVAPLTADLTRQAVARQLRATGRYVIPDTSAVARWVQDAIDRRHLPSGRPPGPGDGILIRADRDRCRVVARTYLRDHVRPDTALVVQDLTGAHPRAVHRYIGAASQVYTEPDAPVVHLRYADVVAIRRTPAKSPR
jgi:hypothetical protein